MPRKYHYLFIQLISIISGITILLILPSCDSNSGNFSSDTKNTSDEFNQIAPQENGNDIDINAFSGQKFTFKSTLYDKEENATIVQTNHETTFHIFDFAKKTVTMKAPMNGQLETFIYPINDFYAQKGLVATTYVIVVGELGVKEIWFSLDVQNLGYDYDDGSRIACYELSTVK